MTSTDPDFLRRKFDESSAGRTSQNRTNDIWRLKKDGEMNYDRKGLSNARPDIVVNSYNRDF